MFCRRKKAIEIASAAPTPLQRILKKRVTTPMNRRLRKSPPNVVEIIAARSRENNLLLNSIRAVTLATGCFGISNSVRLSGGARMEDREAVPRRLRGRQR
jgi:hypothetical protein